jgi:hypothetical protein
MTRIFSTADKSENVEFSFEGYPNNTTQEHSSTFGKLDSNRIAFTVMLMRCGSKEMNSAVLKIPIFLPPR